jgi:hypothetical protein
MLGPKCGCKVEKHRDGGVEIQLLIDDEHYHRTTSSAAQYGSPEAADRARRKYGNDFVSGSFDLGKKLSLGRLARCQDRHLRQIAR